jgi:hypothetical protein
MLKYLKIFLISNMILAGFAAHASNPDSPLGFGIAPPVQFPSEEHSITGIRASLLWGKNRNMHGFDLGLIGNITDQEFYGVGIAGIFNWTRGNSTFIGGQFAGITNINSNRSNVYGVQAAIFANIGDFTDIYGLQIGIYNRAHEVYGLQLGIVNSCTNLHGVQIGLANFNERGPFGVTPLINFGF